MRFPQGDSVWQLIQLQLPRILIVDDHLVVRKAIRAILDLQPFQVCGEAQNGQEAVEKVIRVEAGYRSTRYQYARYERRHRCTRNKTNLTPNKNRFLDDP